MDNALKESRQVVFKEKHHKQLFLIMVTKGPAKGLLQRRLSQAGPLEQVPSCKSKVLMLCAKVEILIPYGFIQFS